MHDENEEIDFSRLTEVFGLESFILKSVGITIGSSTSHLLFSRLVVRRHDSCFNRYEVTERDIIHRSSIVFTPYTAGIRIDAEKLNDFMMRSYEDAKISPHDVDTGAVIITGYAAKKENAEAIINIFSRWAGKFVCATAGPGLEARMSAYGSGAVLLSKKTGKTVMNIDIGGGTSKIVIVRNGEVVDTSSLFVGSRVVATDNSGRVIRMEESAVLAAGELAVNLELGAPLTEDGKKAISGVLTGSLFELIERRKLSTLTLKLMETAPMEYRDPVDIVMFSGGVAEYIYGYEKLDFGDLGPYLGGIIARRVADSNFGNMLQAPVERIRATVIGASQYSLQVSGSTIFISGNSVLPKRNMQVIKILLEEELPAKECVENKVREALSRFDIGNSENVVPIALAVKFSPEAVPSPTLLRNLSNGIIEAFNGTFLTYDSLVLILDIDIANLVGNMLADKIGSSRDIICVDGIEVGDLDYIDIGTEIETSQTLPVVVKNLVF